MNSITNPPRYPGAEDMSGRDRAARRGALTQEEFLYYMKRAGFVLNPASQSPDFAFTHAVLGGRRMAIRPLENFSAAFDRMSAAVAEMIVVKLQKPLDDPNGDWLAYPRGRPWMALIPRASIPLPIREVVDVEFKAFFYARRIGDSHALMFGGQAPDQRW